MPITVYPWDEKTKETLPPIGKPDNHPNPIGRCETDTPPPENIPVGYVARVVLTEEGWFSAWEVATDHRGAEYWSQDGSRHVISELAIEVPAGCLTEPPLSPLHKTHDGSIWLVDVTDLSNQIRAERDGKLNSVYAPAIQQLNRWSDIAEGNPAALAHYKSQRSAWHAWADALCELPNQPGCPWPEGEVPWPEQPPKPTRNGAA